MIRARLWASDSASEHGNPFRLELLAHIPVRGRDFSGPVRVKAVRSAKTVLRDRYLIWTTGESD